MEIVATFPCTQKAGAEAADVRFGSLADICSALAHVRFVPIADIRFTYCEIHVCHSITSSASPINVFGTLRPRALAVFRLITI